MYNPQCFKHQPPQPHPCATARDRGQPPLVPPDCIPSPWPALSHPQETLCPTDVESSTQTPEHPHFALQSRLAQTSNPQPPSSPASWVFAAALLPRIFSSPDKKNQRFAVQQFPWQPHFPILSLNASLTPPGPSCWPPQSRMAGPCPQGWSGRWWVLTPPPREGWSREDPWPGLAAYLGFLERGWRGWWGIVLESNHINAILELAFTPQCGSPCSPHHGQQDPPSARRKGSGPSGPSLG